MNRFLVVGMKKSGTTYLHEQLRTLNQVYVPPLKETHFLLHQSLERRVHLFKQYISNGKNYTDENDLQFLENFFVNLLKPNIENYMELISSNCNYSGECDPELILLEKGKIEALAREKFKIVCCLRHPVDRFFSHIKMIISDKNINPNEFLNHYLRADIKKLQHQINHSLYRIMITRWRSVYTHSDILFIDDKKLRSDKKKTMEKILQFITDGDFLKIDDHQVVCDKNVGSKWKLDADLKERLDKMFEEDIEVYSTEMNKINLS